MLKNRVAPDPYGCSQALREPPAGWRSFHFGKYRVIYKVFQDLQTIAIAGMGKHNPDAALDIYRRLEAVARTGKLAGTILKVLKRLSGPE